MKKVLFATTALVLSAGFASADIALSGYGRFGLSYNSGNYGSSEYYKAEKGKEGASKTWMEQRLRLNIKASTQTDGGIEFGAKARIQYDDGMDSAGVNPAQFYFSYEGAKVEVGNVDTAADNDTAGVFYATEMGLTATGYGDARSSFYAYESKSYDGSQYDGSRSGVYGSYTIDGITAEASYIDPNQYGANGAGVKAEKQLVLSYASGPITVAAGGILDGAGYQDNTLWYAGAIYEFTDQFKAGLTYIDEGKTADGVDLGKTVSLYGTYTTGPVAVQAYVANASGYDVPDYEKNTVFGLGGSYDLGGGTSLLASVQRNFADRTYADFGVKFKF